MPNDTLYAIYSDQSSRTVLGGNNTLLAAGLTALATGQTPHILYACPRGGGDAGPGQRYRRGTGQGLGHQRHRLLNMDRVKLRPGERGDLRFGAHQQCRRGRHEPTDKEQMAPSSERSAKIAMMPPLNSFEDGTEKFLQ